MSDAALLPCPFCGGEAEYERVGTPKVSCIVVCTQCGARHESSDQDWYNGKAWNQRAALAVSHPAPEVATPRPKTVLRYGSDFPSRQCMDLFSVGESAIRHAVDVVEGMGASVHLTDAVILLAKARAKVADHVEGVPARALDGVGEAQPVVPSNDSVRDALDALLHEASRNTWGHYNVLGFIKQFRDKHFPAALPEGTHE